MTRTLLIAVMALGLPYGGVHAAHACGGIASSIAVGSSGVLGTTDVGTAPSAVAIHAATGIALVVNSGSNTVTQIALGTGAVLATIPVGSAPSAVAIHEGTGIALVANSESNTVTQIALGTGTVLGTIAAGNAPNAVAIHEGTGVALVLNRDSNTVTQIALGTGTVLGTIPVGSAPSAVAIHEGTGIALVANSGSNTVTQIALGTGTVLGTIAVGNAPSAVAIHQGTGVALVVNTGSNTVTEITLGTGTVLGTTAVGAAPSAVAIHGTTGIALVVNTGSNTVTQIALGTGTVLGTTAVGAAPSAVAIHGTTGIALVVNTGSNTVTQVALGTGTVLATTDVGAEPSAVAIHGATGIALVLGTALPATPLPTSGLLDPAFGAGGKVITSAGPGLDWAYDVAIQPDGKLVVTGFGQFLTEFNAFVFLTARYDADGTLDTEFGDGGKAITHFDAEGALQRGATASAYGVVIDEAGKILVAGAVSSGTLGTGTGVVRYTSSGQLDASFADGGRKVVSGISTGGQFPKPLLLQPDGKILLSGSVADGLGVARLHADGSMDAAFGTGGIASVDVPDASDVDGIAGALQADGKIVVAGHLLAVSGELEMVVARFDEDGSLDVTFGDEGLVRMDVKASGYFLTADVAVQAEQKILVLGSIDNGVNLDVAVVRLNPDGTLDGSFGVDGTAIARPVPRHFDYAAGMTLQDDGKILVAGYSSGSEGTGSTIVRLTCTGLLDRTFDGNGSAFVSFGKQYRSLGQALAVQPDGNVVVAGVQSDFSQKRADFALLRILGGGRVCPETPLTGCRTAANTLVTLEKEVDDTRDGLLWKWSKGDALSDDELDDPTTSDAYGLCVYAGANLVSYGGVSAVGGWKAAGALGYTFKGTSSEGVTSIKLKAGAAGKSKAQVKGQGPLLPDPPLPLTLPVTVQLTKQGSPVCLESTFSASDVRRNDATEFQARKK